MTAAWSFREAGVQDLHGVLEVIEQAGLDEPGSNDRTAAPGVLARIRAAGGVVLIAEREGRVLGSLTLFVLPLLGHQGAPAALLEDVAVHPGAQRQGLGRALMVEALRRAREAGCYKLALSSRASRRDAHRFYEALGFQQHGVSFVVDVRHAPEALR